MAPDRRSATRMTPERWQQVRGVFDHVASLPSAERSAYLDQACSADPDLRREVESLLLAHHEAGTEFLNTPAINLSRPAPPAPSRVGRRIGAYNILEEIGRGGMGEVYRAGRADGQYEKEVAIKLVRGGYNTASVLERFRHERQILASLDHPNIARLLDGGTTDEGLPYLVMELIEGTPIDQYCDALKLGVNERLHLFVQVCSAVQYAHQRLVIHRDIKPGNILVTKEGVPKLLDFGIAKILDPAASAATTVAGPMTPEYASPEQIRGEPITTATDVYSLGVVLYQLLTGHSPYPKNTSAPHEFARAICEIEPERPSAVVLKPA
jgi:eukaryotic-like serine/threonine-protein kinase